MIDRNSFFNFQNKFDSDKIFILRYLKTRTDDFTNLKICVLDRSWYSEFMPSIEDAILNSNIAKYNEIL